MVAVWNLGEENTLENTSLGGHVHHPLVELPDHTGLIHLILLGLSKHFSPSGCANLYFHQQCKGFQLSTSSPTLFIVSRFNLSHSGEHVVVPHCAFIPISLMTNDAET